METVVLITYIQRTKEMLQTIVKRDEKSYFNDYQHSKHHWILRKVLKDALGKIARWLSNSHPTLIKYQIPKPNKPGNVEKCENGIANLKTGFFRGRLYCPFYFATYHLNLNPNLIGILE